MEAQEKDPVVTQEPTGGNLGEGLVAILQDYQEEKDPVVTQEPVGGTLGEGLAAILEGYQDEEEVATP
jgi:thymidylate kinase